MKYVLVFVLGVVIGASAITTGFAQRDRVPALNHVGIVVSDYAESLAFYTEALGFEIAYTVDNPDGSPLLTYLQLNRETFVELIPARPGQEAGITHFGIEVGAIDGAVDRIRAFGATISDPGLTPANAEFARMRDPDDVDIEVMAFGPDARQRQAMEAWDARSD